MPSSTIEPRTHTADERALVPTDQPAASGRRRSRYWFPAGFFAIISPETCGALPVNEDEFVTVLANQQALNAIADHIETLSQQLAIPVIVKGGILQAERQTLSLLITCDPAIRHNISAHREFSHRLCQTYHCTQAGVDTAQDILWLYHITPQEAQA